jgi:two-component system, NarL family, nitrate/nitrite response regulator NarL
MPLRCVIVDDSPAFLEAARALLEREGISVSGTASTSADALRLVDEIRPDIALVDIDLGGESGFDLAAQLAADNGDSRWRAILISTPRGGRFRRPDRRQPPAIGFLPSPSSRRTRSMGLSMSLQEGDDG